MIFRLRSHLVQSVIGLGLVTLAAIAVGCAAVAQTESGLRSEMFKKIEKPKDLIGLLNNLKVATDWPLLLQTDFYTEENLIRFFGGESVSWGTNRGEEKRGEIIGFQKIIEPYVYSGKSYSGLDAFFRRTAKNGQRASATITLTVRSPGKTGFGDVETIFGDRWVDDEYHLPSPHSAPPKLATDPHGNASIVYFISAPKFRSQLQLRFSYDAKLEEVNLSQEDHSI